MTDTPHPLAALLRDVPRYSCTNAGDMEEDPFGKFVFRADILAALTLPEDEAGKVLEGVTPGPWAVEHKYGTLRLMMGDSCQMCDETYYPWVPANEKDWHFIAWCRTGVPALLAARVIIAENCQHLVAAGQGVRHG